MPSTAASKGKRISITLEAPADVGAGAVGVPLPVATVVVEVADAVPDTEVRKHVRLSRGVVQNEILPTFEMSLTPRLKIASSKNDPQMLK